jgi:hypothetical protein
VESDTWAQGNSSGLCSVAEGLSSLHDSGTSSWTTLGADGAQNVDPGGRKVCMRVALREMKERVGSVVGKASARAGGRSVRLMVGLDGSGLGAVLLVMSCESARVEATGLCTASVSVSVMPKAETFLDSRRFGKLTTELLAAVCLPQDPPMFELLTLDEFRTWLESEPELPDVVPKPEKAPPAPSLPKADEPAALPPMLPKLGRSWFPLVDDRLADRPCLWPLPTTPNGCCTELELGLPNGSTGG